MKKSILTLIIGASLAVSLQSCNKEERSKIRGLKKIYEQFKDGIIQECSYQGRTVFVANAAGQSGVFYVYDEKGNQIGLCDQNAASLDNMCLYIRGCEYIYVPEGYYNNMSFIDVYGISK